MRRSYPQPDIGARYVTELAPWDHPTATRMTLTVERVTSRFVTFRREVAFADRAPARDRHRWSLSSWTDTIRVYRHVPRAEAGDAPGDADASLPSPE